MFSFEIKKSLVEPNEDESLIGYGDNDPFLLYDSLLNERILMKEIEEKKNAIHIQDTIIDMCHKHAVNDTNLRLCKVSFSNEDFGSYIPIGMKSSINESKWEAFDGVLLSSTEKKKHSFVSSIIKGMGDLIKNSLEVFTVQFSLVMAQKTIIIKNRNKLFYGPTTGLEVSKFLKYSANVIPYETLLEQLKNINNIIRLYKKLDNDDHDISSAFSLNEMNNYLSSFDLQLNAEGTMKNLNVHNKSLLKVPLKEQGWKNLSVLRNIIDTILRVIDDTGSIGTVIKNNRKLVDKLNANSKERGLVEIKLNTIKVLNKQIVRIVLNLTVSIDKLCRIAMKVSGIK